MRCDACGQNWPTLDLAPGDVARLMPAIPSADGTLTLVTGERLTPRERDVLEAVWRGAGNDGIARQLGVSVGAVENHMTSLYAKLDLPRARLALLWEWLRLLEVV